MITVNRNGKKKKTRWRMKSVFCLLWLFREVFFSREKMSDRLNKRRMILKITSLTCGK